MVAPSAAIAVFLAVIAGVAVVAGSYSTLVSGPTAVRLDGVALTITYLNGSLPIFGPTHQNACNESEPTGYVGPWSPPFGPDCPTELVQGNSYDLQFFITGNSDDSAGL